ncbi:MAG: lamin tail domain-containing protein [Deltaproteobacteria bacterium]|nr:lamin tail domain-containing protein [Deltaproteobacteria bacterium]
MRPLASILVLVALTACTREATISVRNEDPDAAILVPVSGATVFSDDAVEFCARASDDTDDISLLAMSLASDRDDLLWSSTYAPEAIGACDGGEGVGITLSGLSVGTHVLSFRVVDTKGADALAEATLVVEQRPNDAPACEILEPWDGTVVLQGTPVRFNATVSDADQSADSLSLLWMSDEDGNLNEDPADPSGTAAFETTLSVGDHLVQLQVEDEQGARDVCFTLLSVDPCGDLDGDGVTNCDGDCDEHDAQTYPGAAELPDLEDNDCDGVIDEGTVFFDDDGDGYCEGPLSCADGTTPGDCDDAAPSVHPGADEDGGAGTGAGNGVDDDCDGQVDNGTSEFDDDGDGYSELTGDCDDADPTVHPGRGELCDGIDNDCDGAVDNKDLDLDGHRDAACGGDDCDDANPYAFAGAEELCGNGADDDCDGVVDNRDEDGDGWISAFCGGDDCHDGSAAVAPGMPELCDRLDNDCDGEIDNRDQDGDGYTDGACVGGDDCDDADDTVHPGAVEVCGDSVDEDCSGLIDDLDLDGDGYRDAACAGGTDCDDGASAVHPLASEVCGDHVDNDCTGVVDDRDVDRDGYLAAACGGEDCDDGAASISPSRLEVCGNAVDEDCSGAIDDLDQDRDGWGACDGSDCDDTDPAVNPGAVEVCDGADRDCSGVIDDRDLDLDGHFPLACGGDDCDDLDAASYPGAAERADRADNDCDATVDEGTVLYDDDGDGYSESEGDCDDASAARSPALPELCGDGIDNDCSRVVDDLDADGDGFFPVACGGHDCDDSAAAVFPGAVEACDGLDNDCSGVIDDLDEDGDHYYAEACGGDDCDDGNYWVNPGEVEICGDLYDEDCSGSLDDADYDGDGHIDDEPACGGDDCADDDPMVYPGAPEVFDGAANDCDGSGVVDEGVVPAGAIVISEVMPSPDGVSDMEGEWFELFNPGERPVNVSTWTVYDNNGHFEVDVPGGLWIGPGEAVALCANDDPAANGGVDCAYDYDRSNLQLTAADRLQVRAGAFIVDQVTWDSGWNFGDGESMSLGAGRTSAVANDLEVSWCEGAVLYNPDDMGTPGAANPSCDTGPAIAMILPQGGPSTGGEVIRVLGDHFTGAAAVTVGGAPCTSWSFVSDEALDCTVPAGSAGADADVAVRVGVVTTSLAGAFHYTGTTTTLDACTLLEPSALAAGRGTSTRLFSATLTESGLTSLAGAPAGISAELGYGPVGSVPGRDAGWRWVDGVWSEQAGAADLFVRSLALQHAGTYAVAWRFSRDGGDNWLYCDRSPGSSNGVSASDLGTLVVR